MGLPNAQAIDLEVEPLKMWAFGIRFDCQPHVQRVGGIQHLNVAAVKVTADMKRGGHHSHRPNP